MTLLAKMFISVLFNMELNKSVHHSGILKLMSSFFIRQKLLIHCKVQHSIRHFMYWNVCCGYDFLVTYAMKSVWVDLLVIKYCTRVSLEGKVMSDFLSLYSSKFSKLSKVNTRCSYIDKKHWKTILVFSTLFNKKKISLSGMLATHHLKEKVMRTC